jgi:hypothetical protein
VVGAIPSLSQLNEGNKKMQVRKVAASAVLGVGVSALALAGAGAASANPYHKPPTPPKVTIQAQKVVVRDNGQVGNGNVSQTASGNAGAISNPQVGFGTNVGLQVPLNVGLNAANGPLSSNTGADQTAKQRQSATGNDSYNSTSVNNAEGNGNHSDTSIGTQSAH